MTREDAIEMLRYNSNVIHQTMDGRTDSKEVEALDMAIKALKQESCDDCISRHEVKELFQEACEMEMYDFLGIDDLQLVTPHHTNHTNVEIQSCDDAISRQIISDYVESHIQEINTGYGDLNQHTNKILRMIVDYIESMPPIIPKSYKDAISRQAVLDMMQIKMSDKELYMAVYKLPSVNPQPQESKQEPCEDAVSREAILLEIDKIKDNYGGLLDVAMFIRGLPSVSPKPKTGHWISHKHGAYYECSNCREHNNRRDKYCPNCEAKMVESEVSNADSN